MSFNNYLLCEPYDEIWLISVKDYSAFFTYMYMYLSSNIKLLFIFYNKNFEYSQNYHLR